MSAPTEEPQFLDRQVGRSAFGTDVEGYHSARSGYPPALFRYLARRTKPSPRILEIGSGTGLATVGLAECNPKGLTLLEPDPRLCSFLEHRFSSRGANVVCGTFPETAIDGPFDLVVCAAAFHWMEPGPALEAVKALLVPGGVWAMWWNCYFGHGEEDVFAEEFAKLLLEEGVALPPSYRGRCHYALETSHHLEQLQDAGFRDVDHQIFRTSREYDEQRARDLCASFSFIRLLSPDTRTVILDRISRAVREDHNGGASGVVVTSLYACST